MDFNQIFAIIVFLVAIVAIISERVHRTLVAIAGMAVLLLFHVLTFDQAISHIDFNTLGVLFGMMLFVAVVRISGLFEYLAIQTAKLAKGDPWLIMVLFVLLTAALSALLDNVTTVLLIGPMTLTICGLLKINPVPFFIVEIMASNIGGTATLIGDPPNIMIGSAAGFTFGDFVMVDTPAVIIILIVVIALFRFIYGRNMKVAEEDKKLVMELSAADKIEDPRLLKQSLVMLGVVVLGFSFHGVLGIESSVVAISAAAALLLISRRDIVHALSQVGWTTLAFFAGLFVIVGAMAETGTIDALAQALIDMTGGNVFVAMIVLLIASALISAVLDNIPFVATMIPILLAMESASMDVTPLWWAVSLGACLGGNGTLIGASANVVLSDISARNGHPITFIQYLKVGFPIMLVTVAISCIYLIVRFPPA